MADPKLKFTAGALPYDDGSGDQVTASVERTDEGVMLRFEVVHCIKIGDWPRARAMIDSLVKSASDLNGVQ